MEFKPFEKIANLKNLIMAVTQKIHGTNAAVFVFEYTSTNGESHEPRKGLRCQSRNRIITPENDNYGFATFVHAHKEEFIEKLGLGLHFGEWAGPGINSGEGLTEKTFILFDYWKFPPERPLPPRTCVVPVLYLGPVEAKVVDQVSTDLKTNGSKLAPGFMRPEGIVVTIAGTRYKHVFDPEETQWKKSDKIRAEKPEGVDYSYLLQPIRLEKLLSKDSRLIEEYPKSLPEIAKSYMADLIEEGQISGTEDEMAVVRKGASKDIFSFIKAFVSEQARKE